MAVRVPAILDSVLANNPDYAPEVRARLVELRDSLPSDAALPPLGDEGPDRDGWLAALAARAGETWLGTDWFFAEHYVYRQLADRSGFWRSGRDPFRAHKLADYEGDEHASALESALAIAGPPRERLHALLGAAVFGNRIDLSFAAALERGIAADPDDLLLDERPAIVERLLGAEGPVHVVLDNAGSELSVDLVLVDALLCLLGARVVLHVKVHPAFVSDVIPADLGWFLGSDASDDPARALFERWGPAARALRERLRAALDGGSLEIAPHVFWNGPASLWELPPALHEELSRARLVVLKGDAHYRRALGDAIWPAEASFADVTAYFPAPLCALRTLKSDPLVGLPAGERERLERLDPRFRVNGKRGLASLGGRSS